MTRVGAAACRGSLTDIPPPLGEKKYGVLLLRSVSKYCIVRYEMQYTLKPFCIILEKDVGMAVSINR